MAGRNYGELLREAKFEVRGGLVPEGTYTARIDEAELKEFNGTPAFAVTFVIESGEEAGRKVRNTIFTPRAGTDERARKDIGIFFGKLFALGLSQEFVNSVTSDEQLAKALIGTRGDIVVYHRPSGEKTYANVRYINPPSTPAPEPADGPRSATGFNAPAAPAAAFNSHANGGNFAPAAPKPTSFTPPPIGQVSRPTAPPAQPTPPPAPAAPSTTVMHDAEPVDF